MPPSRRRRRNRRDRTRLRVDANEVEYGLRAPRRWTDPNRRGISSYSPLQAMDREIHYDQALVAPRHMTVPHCQGALEGRR